MKEQAYFLHALSPLHAGVGTAADIVDLPIARMQATGIPIVPGSSIKGVLRDACSPGENGKAEEKEKWLAAFGPEQEEASRHAGAIVVGDARLLALPVRSFKGTFAWVTSPLLLRLAARDMQASMKDLPVIPQPDQNAALVADNPGILVKACGHIYLQDIDIPASTDSKTTDWAVTLARLLFPENEDEQQHFVSHFALVDDEIMTFLWETATQVDTRVRIDPGTGVVAQGALWLEESLPPETVLIGLMAADRARRKFDKLKNWGSPDDVMAYALGGEKILQFGGKATVGRGRCRILHGRA